jgi:cytokinin dehydrogenase
LKTDAGSIFVFRRPTAIVCSVAINRRSQHGGQTMHRTRRSFVKLAGASLLASGVGSRQVLWTRSATAQTPGDLPKFDGEVLFDESARSVAGGDFGNGVHRPPFAILRPRSVDDIVRIMAYANKSGRKLAMRGRGHSLYGQAQVEGGIVIDSSTLNAIRPVGDDLLDVEPGALWGDVAKAALAQGRIPPVVVDALMLSVGGTLSVGGIGETSYREGCQVDHVRELDVVTASGDQVTCSAERDDELFRMTLAGLGQCGIIVRARLRLAPRPGYVVLRTLNYADLQTLVSDQGRLATVEGLGPLTSRIVKEPTGQVRFQLIGGTFFADGEAGDGTPPWMTGLRHASEAAPVRLPYWGYLDRRTASQMTGIAAVKRGQKNPSLAFMLPEASITPFVTNVLTTPETFVGIWLIEVFPMLTARFTQPLFKMPAADLSFGVRLQRRTSAEQMHDPQAMLAANQTLLTQLLAAGGKVYPPYAPILSQEQWQQHYEPATWQRLRTAKKRYDPNNVLTPGAGIF